MDIAVSVSSPEPVYEQIVRQIQDGVRSGALAPGASLPPVRQLAGDLVLNRNTVARAYKMLEERGVIQTAGRKGTFVRKGAAAEVDRLKNGSAERAVREVVATLLSDGVTSRQISTMFREALAVAAGRE
jgi:DNA-binding transcriptional regulator YhcF (GntR family)